MKTKCVILDSARYVEDDEGNWSIISTPEVVELNSNMINAFSANEKKYGSSTFLCDIKFIQRDSYDVNDIHTLNYHVQCTSKQLADNMKLILQTIEELKAEDAKDNVDEIGKETIEIK